MATRGLSLVGFLDQSRALYHLGSACVPADPDPAALLSEWLTAKGKIGGPLPRSGLPEIRDMPAITTAHTSALVQLPWIKPYFNAVPGIQFKMVEVDPLLAYQLSVDLERSEHHCGLVGTPPTEQQLLEVCLPLSPPDDKFSIDMDSTQSAILLRTRCLNLMMQARGHFPGFNFIGIEFGWALGLTHVVKYDGRCYLHNGFHRAVGLRKAGATHIPCIFREVATPEEVGFQGANLLTLADLQANSPPTLGHFTQSLAHEVRLRAVSRIIHVSWSDYIVPEE